MCTIQLNASHFSKCAVLVRAYPDPKALTLPVHNRYGGILETKSLEATLDDLWTLNLDKLDKWNCLRATDLQWTGEGPESDDDRPDSDDSSISGDDSDDYLGGIDEEDATQHATAARTKADDAAAVSVNALSHIPS